ncbi:MAG: DUF3016 domain-containing protein [Betaproteobacteria bacterium]|nr:DUF3016 domain-containing protein [Betaproteobacteria bacterium]
MRTLLRCLVLSLALMGLPAVASVEASFLPADQYADIGEGIDARRAMKEIQGHLVKLGTRYLRPDFRQSIDVVEVDLAGNMKMVGRRTDWVRVLNGKVDAPLLRLRCTPRLGKQVMSRGEDTLTDPMYLDHSVVYSASTPLYQEKALLKHWFKMRVGTPHEKNWPLGPIISERYP